jgi:quercetin dioxygenase-like cupin family protein
MAPGRSGALKLVGKETADSIMLFEETAPSGTETTFHLHRDSDEVAWVLSGEITLKIGDEVTVGGPSTCAFMPRGVPHAWKNTSRDRPRPLPLHPGQGGRILRGTAAAPGGA